jgi:SAM-dependent methyltransferase
MSELKQKRDFCVLCGSKDLQQVVQLAAIPLHVPNNEVPTDLDERQAALSGVPLDLNLCAACGQVQVGYVADPVFLYRRYQYQTSLSLGLTAHFEEYCREVIAQVLPAAGGLVIEIGSNDGTLLRQFKSAGLRTLGIDPATGIAEQATAQGIETIGDFFTSALANAISKKYGRASIVVANNVMANIDDMRDFADGIGTLLAPDGVFVFETQYGLDVVERTLLDTIYHEHVSYFMIKPLKLHFARHGMELIDVKRVPTKGGSIRAVVQKTGGPRRIEPIVDQMVRDEEHKGAFGPGFYGKIGSDLRDIRREIGAIVEEQRRAGRAVAGYGVSVGTSTLLSQFDVAGKIDFLVDDDPKKEATMQGPGYSIPVLPRDAIYERKPGAIIVFAWRYADPIMAKHGRYLEDGGSFVIPLPRVRVVHAAAGRSTL